MSEYWILGTGCHLDWLIVKLVHFQVCFRSPEKMVAILAKVSEVIVMRTNLKNRRDPMARLDLARKNRGLYPVARVRSGTGLHGLESGGRSFPSRCMLGGL